MSKNNTPLSVGQLAKLFFQLKQLESTGLPAFQAFAMVMQTDVELKMHLTRMQQQLKAGKPISEAGFRAGIFNDTHKTLIHAAERSGKLIEVYGQLASYYTALDDRIKKIKSRLYFPALTLMIALFVQPLPALVTSQISGFDYLQLSLGRLLIIASGIFVLVRFSSIIRGIGLETALHRLQLRVSIVANWIIKRQINQFLFILGMMLEGGLAFAEALPKAVNSINNTCLREKFNPALDMLTTGTSVTDMLAKVPIINAKILQIVNSNEQSGKLAFGLLHFSQQEAEAIGLQDDALAEWLPRLVYSIIAIGMAYSLLGNHISTAMPSTL